MCAGIARNIVKRICTFKGEAATDIGPAVWIWQVCRLFDGTVQVARFVDSHEILQKTLVCSVFFPIFNLTKSRDVPASGIGDDYELHINGV